MDTADEIGFLRLIRDKVDILINDVVINDPLIEISSLLTSRIRELEQGGDYR